MEEKICTDGVYSWIYTLQQGTRQGGGVISLAVLEMNLLQNKRPLTWVLQ